VRLEITPGQIVTASITNEAVEELGLKGWRYGNRDRQSIRCHDRSRLEHDPEK